MCCRRTRADGVGSDRPARRHALYARGVNSPPCRPTGWCSTNDPSRHNVAPAKSANTRKGGPMKDEYDFSTAERGKFLRRRVPRAAGPFGPGSARLSLGARLGAAHFAEHAVEHVAQEIDRRGHVAAPVSRPASKVADGSRPRTPKKNFRKSESSLDSSPKSPAHFRPSRPFQRGVS